MYVEYWNLQRSPFENDFASEFFFRSRTHLASLLKLRYLIDSNKGCGLLTGVSGAGKTFVTRVLAEELDEQFTPFVCVRYPFMTPSELISYITTMLGGQDFEEESAHVGLDRILLAFESSLASHANSGRHPVIVIDEAHLIDNQDVLQSLQLLMNFRQDTPFTLLLAGQPTLLSRISRIPEFDEQIGVKSLLAPFSRDETAEYIAFRLNEAGCESSAFDRSAIDEIHELSGGVPRLINRLADLTLLVGFADGIQSLTSHEVGSVADEVGLKIAG